MNPRFALAINTPIAVMLMLFAGYAAAQTYPTKPIRVVLPVAPGGGSDVLARTVGSKLSQALGQAIVIDNRSGAGGNIALATVAGAAPDGYTLYMGVGTRLTVNPLLHKLTLDSVRDFAPITQVATAQLILVVHPSVPAKSVGELITLAKAEPGRLNYASAGIGSGPHLAAELFVSQTGIEIRNVPYRGGGPAAMAVVSGQVQILFGSVATTLPQVNAGKLRALAVTGNKRSHLIPDLPTIGESGLPRYHFTLWEGMVAPTGTPHAIVSRLHSEISNVLKMPDTRELVNRVGYEVTGTTPEQLAEIIRSETAIWAKLIKAAAIRAE